jgi:hypothetical protein
VTVCAAAGFQATSSARTESQSPTPHALATRRLELASFKEHFADRQRLQHASALLLCFVLFALAILAILTTGTCWVHVMATDIGKSVFGCGSCRAGRAFCLYWQVLARKLRKGLGGRDSWALVGPQAHTSRTELGLCTSGQRAGGAANPLPRSLHIIIQKKTVTYSRCCCFLLLVFQHGVLVQSYSNSWCAAGMVRY